MEVSLEHLEHGYILHFEGVNCYSLPVSSEDMASFMQEEEILNVEDVDPLKLACTYNEFDSIVGYVNQAVELAA